LHAGSGNQHWHKNDSRNDRYVFEQKRTDSTKSITLKEVELRDLRNNAARQLKDGVLTFELNGRDYYVIEDHLWETLNDGA
jgi:hypothetical protein